jgi:hypothetical protein
MALHEMVTLLKHRTSRTGTEVIAFLCRPSIRENMSPIDFGRHVISKVLPKGFLSHRQGTIALHEVVPLLKAWHQPDRHGSH